MKPFGLTGNIGCGKSTVAKFLAEYPDVLIIYTDNVAKEIIAGGSYGAQINALLGTDVFPDGKVDFKLIADIIFSDADKKKRFEELVHPLVWAAVREKVDKDGNDKVCVVESAILYETGSEGRFAAVVVAACDTEEQFRRLRENRKMTNEEIRARLERQLPSSEKESRARFVIHTDCDLGILKNKVAHLYEELKFFIN